MTKHTLLLFLMILIGVIIYYFFQSGLIKFYDPCEESREIYDLIFEGIVVEKVDASPLFKDQYLLIKNHVENNQVKVNLSHDDNFVKGSANSKFWEILNVGDSVSKNKRTFIVSYKHKNSDWIRMKLGFNLCR